MNDRLGELPAWGNDSDDEEDEHKEEAFDDEGGAGGEGEGVEGEGGDIEAPTVQKTTDEIVMEQFFDIIEKIQKSIEEISTASRRIKEINKKSMHAMSTKEEEDLSKALQPILADATKEAKVTKNYLKILGEENTNLKEEKKISQSNIRVRENLINTFTRKFIDEMKVYKNAQSDYSEAIKAKVARQVKVIQPDATDEEIEQVMKSDGGRDALYKSKILAGGVSDQVKQSYEKVKGKYEDVKLIENSVAEIKQMFIDFALLTDQQGELIDQIEYQVKEANEYLEEGNVDMHESVVYQQKIRQKNCWIIVIVVVVVCVIGFFLFK